MAKVSVGVPVYNGAPFIGRCLRVLLEQGHSDLEIVISDNASTDDTRQICESAALADERVRYERLARNIGPIRNFQRVFFAATGQYFMWAAADDLVSPEYISGLVAALARNPGAALACGTTCYVDDSFDELLSRPRTPPPPEPPASRIQALGLLLEHHAASWLYGLYDRRRIADRVRRLSTLPPFSSDVLFLEELVLAEPIVGTREPIFYKRLPLKGEASLHPSTALKMAEHDVAFAGHLIRQAVEAPLDVGDRLRAAVIVVRYLSRWLLRRGPRHLLRRWIRAGYEILGAQK